MKIKHDEILIPKETPFENCKLGREPIAEILTTLIATLPDGFVMAIDNKWGTGKTTFVKMWKQHLENEGYETLYFNAWENDFQNEVIVAFISIFREIKGKSDKKYEALLSNTAKVMKSAFPIAIKGVAGKLIGEETIGDVLKVISEFGVEEVESQIKTFKTQRNSIVGFRKSLADYVTSSKGKKPIICLIDELDRCRPTYAVEVLEKIKHLFSVNGIVFVLSIDKIQLGNSIKGYYGSDLIDSDEYLRRFIDLNYSIMPKPEKKLFIGHLYKYYGFSDFLESEERMGYRDLQHDAFNILTGAELIYKESYTLRQIERSFARVRLTLGAFSSNQYIYPFVLIFLDFLNTFHIEIFNRIHNISLSMQEFFDCIEEIILKIKGSTELKNFEYLMAELAFRYQKSFIDIRREVPDLIAFDSSDNPILKVKSKIENADNRLARIIHNHDRQNNYNISLKWIINKYNLTEPLNF